jgi:hypothetical protein
MKAALLALLVALFHVGEMTPSIETRATGAAQEIVTIVNERLPDAPTEERLGWASVMFVWSRYESMWFADPSGYGDARRACGTMQVHNPHKYIDGATCEKVRKDRKLGFQVGLEVALYLTKKCGSRGLAMSAYSSDGSCPTTVFPLVAKRCKLAGLTSQCEVK